jgi:hypothetical protein
MEEGDKAHPNLQQATVPQNGTGDEPTLESPMTSFAMLVKVRCPFHQ